MKHKIMDDVLRFFLIRMKSKLAGKIKKRGYFYFTCSIFVILLGNSMELK